MGEPIKRAFTAAVAGISHYQDAAYGTEVGTPVEVRREPDNPYDRHAHALYAHGTKIGYVPAEVAKRLDVTTQWSGEVGEVLHGPGIVGLRVRFTPQSKLGGPGQRVTGEVRDAQSQPTGSPLDSAQPVPPRASAATRQTVYARSGRLLGALISIDSQSAHVENGTHITTYPLELIRISDE